VLVDAKVGAGGRIAVDYVKRAAPDGLTILQIPSSPMTLYPNTYKKLTYDPLADFIPVTSTVTYSFVLTAGPACRRRSAPSPTSSSGPRPTRSRPATACPPAGSALHFAGMMLQKASGVEMTAVAYRGGAPLLADVMGGQIPVSISVLGEVMPHIKSGKLRGLAVTSASARPSCPTCRRWWSRASRTSWCRSGWAGSCRPAPRPTRCSA
jgi:tripartite-type tricarboxylate transporter receptor subunit TctC